MTLASPFLVFMTASTRVVLKAFGTRLMREGGVHSPEELKLIVSASRRLGVLAPPQEEMILRALDLENISVREIMVPRPDIFSLPGNLSLEDALQRVVDEQHSRVPVYDVQRGPEHIIGVLYAKDLMRWLRYRVKPHRCGTSGHPAQRLGGAAHHARSAGRARDQAAAGFADRVQGAKAASCGGSGRIRLDRGRGDGGRCAGAIGGRD